MSAAMDKDALRWFQDARWGMFYHFGLYTLLGENENAVRKGPKAEYAALMSRFTAERFDAQAWVDCAASMGARYIVPTSRHGEGFCLWHSKLTRYTVAHTPCRRDIIGELAAACARRGDIKFALYFNWETWLNEDVNDDVWNQKGLSYPEFMEGQLTELLTQYGPIAMLWFDHGHPSLTRDHVVAIHRTIKRLQPECLVNNRGLSGEGLNIGDFRTPEREFPDSDPTRGLVIECCDSMGVGSWGYCRNDAIWSTPTLAARASGLQLPAQRGASARRNDPSGVCGASGGIGRLDPRASKGPGRRAEPHSSLRPERPEGAGDRLLHDRRRPALPAPARVAVRQRGPAARRRQSQARELHDPFDGAGAGDRRIARIAAGRIVPVDRRRGF